MHADALFIRRRAQFSYGLGTRLRYVDIRPLVRSIASSPREINVGDSFVPLVTRFAFSLLDFLIISNVSSLQEYLPHCHSRSDG